MDKTVLIVFLTLGVILTVTGLKYRRTRWANLLAVAGVAVIALTAALRLLLGS